MNDTESNEPKPSKLSIEYIKELHKQTEYNIANYLQKARAAMSAMELKDASYFIGRANEERAREGLLEELLK